MKRRFILSLFALTLLSGSFLSLNNKFACVKASADGEVLIRNTLYSVYEAEYGTKLGPSTNVVDAPNCSNQKAIDLNCDGSVNIANIEVNSTGVYQIAIAYCTLSENCKLEFSVNNVTQSIMINSFTKTDKWAMDGGHPNYVYTQAYLYENYANTIKLHSCSDANFLNIDMIGISQTPYRIEAEACTLTSASIIDSNPIASDTMAVDCGDGGMISFDIVMNEDIFVDIVVGYYTGNTGAKIGLDINDTFSSNTVPRANGWCAENRRLADVFRVTKKLNSGINTIKVNSDNISQSKYINLDFIDIDPVGENILPFEQIDEFYADGMRIQAEYATDYVGNFVNKNIEIHQGGTGSDGYTLASSDGNPSWKVHVQNSGRYYFQAAYYGGNSGVSIYESTSASYDFYYKKVTTGETITETYTFYEATALWNTNAYSSKIIEAINLEEGDYIIYFLRKNNYMDLDWFRLYQLDLGIDDRIEAEDVVIGDANVQKNQNLYPVLSNYAVELAAGMLHFEVYAESSGHYQMYMAGYTETLDSYLFLNINNSGFVPNKVGENAKGWLSPTSTKNYIIFQITLTQGLNTIEIKKGNDDIAYNYVDIDYIEFAKDGIIRSNISMGNGDSISLDELIDFETDINAIYSSNAGIVDIVGDKVIALGSGKAYLTIEFVYDGVGLKNYITIEVSKGDYPLADEIKALDTTKTYNGRYQNVDVICPSGWTCLYEGSGKAVGSYNMKVTFKHPNYNDIIRNATLTIVTNSRTYTGDDLILEDKEVTYDGKEQILVASCPIDWSFIYLTENVYTEVGTYTISVKFTHNENMYDDVTKTATLTISAPIPPKDNTGLILGITFGSIGAVATTIGVIFLFKYIKKKKNLLPR